MVASETYTRETTWYEYTPQTKVTLRYQRLNNFVSKVDWLNEVFHCKRSNVIPVIPGITGCEGCFIHQ